MGLGTEPFGYGFFDLLGSDHYWKLLSAIFAMPPDLTGVFKYQSSKDFKESMVIW